MTPEQERDSFERWWYAQGKYYPAGGGEHEEVYAYRAWQARAALQPVIPEGWQLVPIEPTEEMNEEGCQGYMQADDKCWLMHKSSMAFAYKAMLAAAPNPEEQS